MKVKVSVRLRDGRLQAQTDPFALVALSRAVFTLAKNLAYPEARVAH